MPIGNPNEDPKGPGDYHLGHGHGGNKMDSSATLTMGDGSQVSVPLTVHGTRPPLPAAGPVHVQRPQEPTMEPFNEDSVVQFLITTKVGKGLTYIPSFTQEIWITSKVKRGSSWVIPREPKDIRVVNHQDWRDGVQSLVKLLCPVNRGPLNPELVNTLDDILGSEDNEHR